jgi:hypothetical protein
MKYIGCDFHPSFQVIAMLDKETGALVERRLLHTEEARAFYEGLKGPVVVGTQPREKRARPGPAWDEPSQVHANLGWVWERGGAVVGSADLDRSTPGSRRSPSTPLTAPTCGRRQRR